MPECRTSRALGSRRHGRACYEVRSFSAGDIRRIRHLLARLDRLDRLIEAVGRIEARQVASDPSDNLNAHEFRVFSQNGEDGVIQFLLSRVAIENKLLVEFGVGDYSEANTRFLCLNDHWSGFVIEGNSRDVTRLKRDPTLWRFDITVLSAFITRENINDLLVLRATKA